MTAARPLAPVSARPFYDTHAALLNKGWCPIPIGSRETPLDKKPVAVSGVTGNVPFPSIDQIRGWAGNGLGVYNVGTRMPMVPGAWMVIGVDVDGLEGQQLIQAAEAELGDLPLTWTVTARGPGQPRRIHLYRAAIGEKLPGKATTPETRLRVRFGGKSVEILHPHYRYAMMPPSWHPGVQARYQCYGPDGAPCPVPATTDLPWMGRPWLDMLTEPVAVDSRPTREFSGPPADADELTRRYHEWAKVLRECPESGYIENPDWFKGPPVMGVAGSMLAYKVGFCAGQYAGAHGTDTAWLVEDVLWEQGAGHWSWDPGKSNGAEAVRHEIEKGVRDGYREPRPWEEALKIGQVPCLPIPQVATPAHAPPPKVEIAKPGGELEVTNAAMARDWLWSAIGVDGALAGIFIKDGHLVRTCQVGQEGYAPLSRAEGDHDGLAQLRPVTFQVLCSVIDRHWACFRTKPKRVNEKDDEAVAKAKEEGPDISPELFPHSAAQSVLATATEAPNIRVIGGVAHSPVVRVDGSLLTEPGYDKASRMLLVPDARLSVPKVPDAPTPMQVAAARSVIHHLLADFSFVTESDRCNYVGAMMTPLLRLLQPPPWKMPAISAHQPGSGKTYLADALRTLYGGVLRASMAGSEKEIQEEVHGILSADTGPVVVFDNVTGRVKSPTMAGLATSTSLSKRTLGSNTIHTYTNDRMWVINGNNINLDGDMPRRVLQITIDPGVPNPENRTNFAIANWPAYVERNRGIIIWSLLTYIRAWVHAGQPGRSGAQGMLGHVETVRAILTEVGEPGVFDGAESHRQKTATEDQEWGAFYRAVREVVGTAPWTCKEVLSRVGVINGLPIPGAGATIDPETLPDVLTSRHGGDHPARLARPLGNLLRSREGRWCDGLTVRNVGVDRCDKKLWAIVAPGE